MVAPAIDIVLHISLEYWWMFFVAFVIATVGNASGVGGGPFFSTIFLLILHLPAPVAVGTSMLTKAFGLSSGSYAFWKKDMIDFASAKKLLIVAVPLVMIGSYLVKAVNPSILTLFIAIIILFISYSIYKTPKEEELKGRSGFEAVRYGKKSRKLENSFEYLIDTVEGWGLVGLGAFLDGLTSASLGEFNNYLLIVKSRVPTKNAVATSVFILAVCSIASAVVLVWSGQPMLEIVIFTIPGVVLGAQVGARIAEWINPNLLKKFISLLLVFVSILLIIKAASGLGIKL